jgi:hypothetical protein
LQHSDIWTLLYKNCAKYSKKTLNNMRLEKRV